VGPGAGARAPAPGSRRAVRGGPGAEGSLLMTALIETRLEDHVWTIVLNRPEKRNALTVEMIGAFHDAVHEAAGRRDVRVVVVAAAGPTFCAGLDLRELAAQRESGRVQTHSLEEALDLLERCPHLTIAAFPGAAIPGGRPLGR